MESEIEETDYDSVEETSSVLSTEEWEDDSDSWETDNGLTTEDDNHNADATDTATPTPTPTGSTAFIIPPQDSSSCPTKGTPAQEGEISVASPASGGREASLKRQTMKSYMDLWFSVRNQALVGFMCLLLLCWYFVWFSAKGPLCAAVGTTPAGAVNGTEKPSKDGAARGFRELKEALKILESLKNMTVEQLWTGGSPTSPTSAEPSSAAHVASSVVLAASEKPTKEKRFLDDIKKLQENLRKTLDTVAIVEEEKMEAVVEAVGSGSAGTEVGVLTAVMLLPVTGCV